MVQRNLTNGLVHTSMSAIGKIIKKMGLEFNITKMEINMREDGLRIKDMDKERFGFAIPKTN